MTVDSNTPSTPSDDLSDSNLQPSVPADNEESAELHKKINPLFSDDADDDDYDYTLEDERESRAAWYFAGLFIIVICTGVIVLGAVLGTEDKKITIVLPESYNELINGKRAPQDTPMMLPGLIAPVTLTAQQAQVTATEQVIGVTIGEQNRAYILSAFDALGAKVINDLIQEIPITVTYCDIHERARVFTSAERGEYLTVGLGGWMDREMFFYFDNIRFGHSSENAPLPDYPYIITTWGEWLEQHPASRIYLGDATVPEENESFDSSKPEIDSES